MRRVAVALATLALLAACTSRTHESESAGSPAVVATTAPATSASLPSASSHLSWSPCGAGLDCASVAVPLDYANPSGRTISIALSRRKASGIRVGSLLVNPGGPGESGVANMSLFESILSPELLDHFDVIAFDPRGVGASDGVQCLNGPAMDAWLHVDPVPATASDLNALVASDRAFTRACQAHSGDILPYVGTVNAARDIEAIRIALGDGKLNYFGFSYGTELGLAYAEQYPTRIRTMVLDGAVDPAVDPVTADDVQAAGFDKELNDFFADCASSPSCAWRPPGFDGSVRSLHAAYDALMASLRSHPLAVGDRSVGPGEAFLGVVTPLYSRDSWPDLADALQSAGSGGGAPLLELFDSYVQRSPNGSFSDTLAANAAVTCADQVWPTDPQAYAGLAATASKAAPEFGAANVYGSLTCAVWPVRGSEKPHAVHAPGSPAIVVIGSTGDPATPYVWARAVASELEHGVLLTRNGDGHTGYQASKCIRTYIDAYLVSMTVPAAGTTCPTP